MLEHMTPFGPQVRNQMTQTNNEFIEHNKNIKYLLDNKINENIIIDKYNKSY